jgi:signal transduction histidine kinase
LGRVEEAATGEATQPPAEGAAPAATPRPVPVPAPGPALGPATLWPAALAAVAALGIALAARRDPVAAEGASDLAEIALYAMVTVLCWVAARRHQGAQRRGWGLLAAAGAIVFVAYAALIGLAAAGATLPAGDQLLPLLALVNLVSFAGLLFLSPPDLGGRSRSRLGLDGLIAGGSLLFLVLAASERPLVLSTDPAANLLSDLLYPAVDAAGFTVAVLVIAHVGRTSPAWYLALAIAMLLVFVADSVIAAGSLPDWAMLGVTCLYLGLIGSAALLARPWPERKAQQEPLWGQAAIYIPFGLAMLGACYDFLENGGLEASLFFLLVGLVGLVVVRTVMLLGENRHLYADFEATDQFKTQLLRFISHEIANPLSPLKVQVSLLRSGQAKDPDRAWQAVDRSIGRLESLSRDVRLMALAETRRIVQSTTVGDLVPRVSSSVQAHQAVAAQRGVQLRAEMPQYPLAVPVDGERFDQVIDNLLSNALKFTPAGGAIDVKAWRAPGGWAVVEVRDSGAGMTPEQQARLFSAFGRPQGSTTPGLGLGLYLCKAIVDGHEGRITATSEGAGKGSRFRVELPPGHSGKGAKPGPRPAYAPKTHDGTKAGVPEGRPADLPM